MSGSNLASKVIGFDQPDKERCGNGCPSAVFGTLRDPIMLHKVDKEAGNVLRELGFRLPNKALADEKATLRILVPVTEQRAPF